ncbi:MAG TPA: methyltransferase domain-containing protein [Xanthobacteraceae bacterium]|jgi:ubiquinone/menaquinone biosynthesis C-methylase UbiE|nr:methyltransferase domain-containing protein [Xanthobacteraceae bacterium]
MTQPTYTFTDGKAYERMMGRWSKIAGDQFLDWIDAPKGKSWIDVGCGNGAFTEVLIARTAPAAVTGVDPSDGQIAFARERPGAKLAQFRTADAQALPFPDKSFDNATMALVIVFLSDPLKAAQEMARVVRAGGIVTTYMWDYPEGFPLRPVGEAMKSLGLGPSAPPNVDAARADSMRRYWTDAGLEAVETKEIRFRISYSSFDDFWESTAVPMGSVGTAIAKMSEETRERLKAKLREQLPMASDGSISYEAAANAVKGRVA